MVAENQPGNLTCSSLQHSQVSTMAPADNALKRSIKFKITSKGIRESETITVNNECRDGVTVNGKSITVKFSMSGNSNKRKPGMILECQRDKKPRMETSFKQQCRSILRSLMEHPRGFAFNQPVDPVKLKIPDYFSIITQPMDLGTIKHKLEDNVYFDAEDFASDVRLTFSNAMLYNPPGNYIHNFAKELSNVFNRRWKLLEMKLKCRGKNLEHLCNLDEMEKNGQDTKPNIEKKGQNAKQSFLNRASVHVSLEKKRPLSLEENQNMRKELVKISRTGMRVMPARTESGCPTLVKTVHKDDGNLSACVAANRKQHDSPAVECARCGGQMCQCSIRRCSVKPSSTERSSDHDHCADSKPDCGVKYPMTSQTKGLKLDSDGNECVSNGDNFQQSVSSPPKTAAIDEGWTSLGNMSPNKALRAAMLKNHFADTIFKARHHSLLDHDKKSNPVNRQKERERLERQQRADKARIAAEFRAAEAASRMKAEVESKMQREREREAARIAVEKMVKTVYINENEEIMEELEAIMGALGRGNLRNPLEQLGLYIKDDYVEGDEEAIL